MAGRDHHTALKTAAVSQVNAGYIEIVLAKLQWSKDDAAFTLHVNPSSYTTAGLQTTDWLAYLGFQRNDQCQFTRFQRCYSKEVPDTFDVQAFATAFNSGFGFLQAAQQGLTACGFQLPQPEGWSFFHGNTSVRPRRGPDPMSGDGHAAMKSEPMKATEDDKFLFRFTFIDTGQDKGFVTHYRPKHPPLSAELDNVFRYLGLRKFDDCPEFDFESCYFRTLRLIERDDNPFTGNVDYAHGIFDRHDTQFSRAIENLLAANAAVEAIGMTFLPIDKPMTRISADIVSRLVRPTKSLARPPTAAAPPLPESFDVAISFAGTERTEAERLAHIIRDAGYAVFYDNYYPEHLWGKNLTIFFDEIFRKRARYCVMFVSTEYADRKWTIHEARSAQARALEEKGNEYILPIRVDDTELEGLLPTLGYVQIGIGVEKIADMLLKKLRAK
jgi:hypothetical protein